MTCVDSQDNTFEDEHCDEKSKPTSKSACIELSCEGDRDEETEDNVDVDEGDATSADASHRHRHKMRNESRGRRRNHYSLPRFRWKIGRWEECSEQCGGVQKRIVACYDRVKGRLELDQGKCSRVRPRPKESKRCNTDCVTGVWISGAWSQCSLSCGQGVRWRQVQCRDDNTGLEISVEYCHDQQQPTTEEPCTEQENCPRPALQAQHGLVETEGRRASWRSGDWTDCSQTCGGGVKERQVECFDEEGMKTSKDLCHDQPQPSIKDSCNQEPCPAWNFGQWTKCDKPCDGGRSRRLVRCQDYLGQTLPDHQCNTSNRPGDTRDCNKHSCNMFRRRRYLWKVGKWSQCSRSCGSGEKFRLVQCVDVVSETISVVGEHLCTGGKKPTANKLCNKQACPFVWRAGDWNQVTKNK